MVNRSRRVSSMAVIEPGEKLVVGGQGVDQHAGLGFEGQVHRFGFGMSQNGLKALDEPARRLGLPCPVVDDARPKRYATCVQPGGDIDGAAQKIDLAEPGLWSQSRQALARVLGEG